jgi:HPt (histidine-containing phosphotransfer) domain-containing protein
MNRTSSVTPPGLTESGPAPLPASLERLRNHFRQVYKLNEDQVEFMLRSASQSLRTTFASAKQALASDDLCSALAPVAHCLKGLLLNLGEGEWAALARIIEKAAEAEQPYEYADVVNEMCEGLSVVADYDRH